ncbi:MAG: YybS family protein [Deltaproteobacteria bacterium]|nr:YybS family protein [Deltaproteobacteria bacterium]MBW2308046.1 YybS family protein [Deltaproteobacteria bacterium]
MSSTDIKNPVKEIILGGGVIALLFLGTSIFPFVGAFFSLFIPIPIMVYYGRLGRIQGRMVAILAVLMAYFVAAVLRYPLNSIVIIQFALLGAIMAEVIARDFSVEKSIIVPSFSLFAVTLVLILLQAIANHSAPSAVIYKYFNETLNDTLSIYQGLGIPDEQVKKIEESAGVVIAVFTRIAPALFLCITALIVWINLIASKKIFQRWGLIFPNFGDLTRWRSPEHLVWLLIGCGGAMLIPVEALRTVSINGLLIMLLVYFFQGIAIVAYFFKAYSVPSVIRIIGYVLISIQQLMLVLVVVVGLFDLWFDFRKITPGRSKKAGSLENGG